MKNIIIKISLIVILVTSVLINTDKVTAEEEPIYSLSYPDGGAVEFYGTIKPNNTFYYGYGIIPEKDLTLEGYAKVTFPNGTTTITSNVKIMTNFDTDLYNSDKFTCSIIVTQEKDYSDTILTIKDDFNKVSYYYSIPITIDINRVEFNPTLTPNYENGDTFKFNDNYILFEKEKVPVTDSLDLKFYNSIGQDISGTISFENKPSDIGITKVNYKFTPYNASSKFKYNELCGYINIGVFSKIEVVNKTPISITLKQNNKLEYKLSWKKSWQNSAKFTNLKPDTVYKIQVRVKEKYNDTTGNLFTLKVRTAKE